MGVAPKLRVDSAWRQSMMEQLLSGQRAGGGFGVHPYSKWKGAHWRLVSLVELGVSRTDRAARAASMTVLDWIAAPADPLIISGKERRHASMEGNALAVCCRLGMARDRRVQSLVEALLRSQWPDGGWNCDRRADAHRSSFHESLAPIWGLVEYHRATGDQDALGAAHRAGELLLDHRLLRSTHTGSVVHPEWTHIHWPHYWHYDFFHGPRAVAMLGRARDGRADEAHELLLDRRKPDGTWRTDGRRYWTHSSEVVDWGDAHEMVTAVAQALVS